MNFHVSALWVFSFCCETSLKTEELYWDLVVHLSAATKPVFPVHSNAGFIVNQQIISYLYAAFSLHHVSKAVASVYSCQSSVLFTSILLYWWLYFHPFFLGILLPPSPVSLCGGVKCFRKPSPLFSGSSPRLRSGDWALTPGPAGILTAGNQLEVWVSWQMWAPTGPSSGARSQTRALLIQWGKMWLLCRLHKRDQNVMEDSQDPESPQHTHHTQLLNKCSAVTWEDWIAG